MLDPALAKAAIAVINDQWLQRWAANTNVTIHGPIYAGFKVDATIAFFSHIELETIPAR